MDALPHVGKFDLAWHGQLHGRYTRTTHDGELPGKASAGVAVGR